MRSSVVKQKDLFVVFENATLVVPASYARYPHGHVPRLHYGMFTSENGERGYAFHLDLSDLRRLEHVRSPIALHRLDSDTMGRRTLFGGFEIRRILDELDKKLDVHSIFRFDRSEYRKISSYFPMLDY